MRTRGMWSDGWAARWFVLGTVVLALGGCDYEDGGPWAGAGLPPTLETAEYAVRTVCGGVTTVKGIDVSYWQGTIAWDRVATTDVRFAYIRMGYGATTDTQFSRNWREAKRVGVRRGAYLYFRPSRDAAQQAQNFLAAVSAAGGYEAGDLPPVIDVETMEGLSATTVAARVRTWIDAVERALGKRPVVYTGSYFWDDNRLGTGFTSSPLWTAHYTTRSCPLIANPWSRWTIWQYSDAGSVTGISGNVDMNRFDGDLAALDRFARGSADDHGNTASTATAVTSGANTAGRLEAGGDVDAFRVTRTSSGRVLGVTTGDTDTYCTLVDASGRVLAENDDANGTLNCRVERTGLPAGTYVLLVRHYSSTGTGPYAVRLDL